MLDGGVLVLNRGYQPVHVTSVRRAFTLLYQGVARAVDREWRTFDFDGWVELAVAVHDERVRTVHRSIRVPRVILLLAYEHLPRARVRFSRLNIYARDKNTCQYCARVFPRSDLNLDHVVPRSQGGKTTWENVVCSCIRCNLKKGGNTPDQAGIKLVRAPSRPRWTPLFRAPAGRRFHSEWLPFLPLADLAYWNTELETE